MRRSRSRSPVRHFNSGRAPRNMLDSSSLEPIRFKKEGFGRNRGGRRSFQSYDDRDRRRPMNRQDRRAHLQSRDYEETKKPMIILDDPSRVPKGSYFEHDRREVVPAGGGLFGRGSGGQSSFRSDQMTSRDADNRSFRRDDDRRSGRSDYRDRDRQDRRSEYQGYSADPFERNSTMRRGFHHHERTNYRSSNQHDDRRTTDRPPINRRRSSPTVWRHDKFEELEQEET